MQELLPLQSLGPVVLGGLPTPRKGPVLPLTGNAAFSRRFHRHPSRFSPSSPKSAALYGPPIRLETAASRDPAQRSRQTAGASDDSPAPVVVVEMVGRVTRFWSAVRHAAGQLQFSQCSGPLRHGRVSSQKRRSFGRERHSPSASAACVAHSRPPAP